MRLPMSRIGGRRPKASVPITTPGWDPPVGWMNAASHTPSGVLISTSVSVTVMAADAELAVEAARPAATDMAMKSRRERSLEDSSGFLDLLGSSMIGSLICAAPLSFWQGKLAGGLPLETFAFAQKLCQPFS